MRAIGVLIFPGFQLLDACWKPLTAFEEACREVSPRPYRLRVMARKPGPVVSSSGVQLTAEPLIDEPLNTLIVAGGLGTREACTCAETLAYVRAGVARARRTASVCSGAFILAAAGLPLDGKQATTHWSRAAEFARAYPRVSCRIRPHLYSRRHVVDFGRRHHGGDRSRAGADCRRSRRDRRQTRRTATCRLLSPSRRTIASSQPCLRLTDPGSRFSPLLGWARERLKVNGFPVERLADRAAMSQRHFARAFAADTGFNAGEGHRAPAP